MDVGLCRSKMKLELMHPINLISFRVKHLLDIYLSQCGELNPVITVTAQLRTDSFNISCVKISVDENSQYFVEIVDSGVVEGLLVVLEGVPDAGEGGADEVKDPGDS